MNRQIVYEISNCTKVKSLNSKHAQNHTEIFLKPLSPHEANQSELKGS